METFVKICMLGMFVCAAIMVFGDTNIAFKPMMLFAFGIMAFLLFGKKKSNGEENGEDKKEE